MKHCSICGEEKPATPEYFWHRRKTPDGLRYACITCERKRRIEYYHRKHPNHKLQTGASVDKKKYMREYAKLPRSRAYRKNYRESEHGKRIRLECQHRREARKRNLPATLTEEEWLDTLFVYDYRCAYCGNMFEYNELERDHAVPLSRGGGYTLENIVPACRPCNTGKSDRTSTEYKELLNAVESNL